MSNALRFYIIKSPSNWTSSNYGIDVYLTVLDIIENLDANGR